MRKKLGRPRLRIVYQGKRQTLKEWSAETGICEATLYYRLKKDMPMEKVFSLTRIQSPGAGAKIKNLLTVGGVALSVRQWSDRTGVSEGTIRTRLRGGKSAAEAIAPIKPIVRPRTERTKPRPLMRPEQRKAKREMAWAREEAAGVREWVREGREFIRRDARKFTGEDV